MIFFQLEKEGASFGGAEEAPTPDAGMSRRAERRHTFRQMLVLLSVCVCVSSSVSASASVLFPIALFLFTEHIELRRKCLSNTQTRLDSLNGVLEV